MGMAESRKEARQLVLHAHFLLNGKKVNIPSISIKVGDVITVAPTSKDSVKFKELAEGLDSKISPKWLEVNKENLSGIIKKFTFSSGKDKALELLSEPENKKRKL
jgi:small subunit ribosomal protein S4